MIGLSESQLELVMRMAAPLSEGKCQEFLERVADAIAVVLRMRGEINDSDVAVAVQLALRGLTYNSAASQERTLNRLATRRVWRLPSWPTKLRNWATSFFAGALAWGKNKLLSQVMPTLDNFNAMLAHGLGRLLPGHHRE